MKTWKRWLSVLLAAVMIVSLMPGSVTLNAYAEEAEDVLLLDTEQEETAGPQENAVLETEPEVMFVSDVIVVESISEQIWSDGDEVLEMGSEPQESAALETEPEETFVSDATTVKIISEWSWDNEEEMLDTETNILALPDESAEQIAYFDGIVGLLPSSIIADNKKITVTWRCDTYPEGGAYEGSYVFSAVLPEGYALAEAARPLEVTVELGGAEIFELEMEPPESAVLETDPEEPEPETEAPESTVSETDLEELEAETEAPESAVSETDLEELEAETEAPESAVSETGLEELEAETELPESVILEMETETEAATASNAVKTISEWSWNDEEEMLDPESHILALPGASAEQPAYFEDIVMLLPSSITAEDEEIPVTWQRDTYPEGGAYEGSYVFTAALPEGYALAEDAAPLNVTVELGGAALLATISSIPISSIPYLDADGSTQTCAFATVVDSSSTAWGNGYWYVVNSNVTITSRITVEGDVRLILADGYTLTASEGINVGSLDSLTIYGQEEGTGTLVADGGSNQAGIGSDAYRNGGNITINGGTVTATGGERGAGIGGGFYGNGSEIIINGGTINATGGYGGAGIGGGTYKDGNSITINGGTVTATGREYGAGIGGGSQGSGSDITVNGGTVTATGGQNDGAGIGGGSKGSGSNITISGGTVTATGGQYGAGIGGGRDGDGSGIKVSGGFVAAVGGSGSGSSGAGAAIGNGGSSGADGTETAESNFINAVVLRQSGSSSTMTGQTYGAAMLDTDARVPAGAILTVPESTSLTLQSGMTLENSGTIYVDSELNFGGSTYGTLTGTDSVYYRLTVNGGSVTTGTVTYPATDGKTYAKEGASVTVAPEDKAGQVFFRWESSVLSVNVTDHSFTMPASPLILTASYQNAVNVSYLDYVNGSFEKKNAWAIPLTSDMTALGSAGAEIWYVVNSDVTIASRITVSGDVHLILADGYTLTASRGIGIPAEGSLTIYGQESGTGALKAAASDSFAGIGGNYGSSTTTDGNNGPITINGGTVTATGGAHGAGIGGGYYGIGNNITINGGMVTATGGSWSAGIGGGYYGIGNNITINGGTVTATGGTYGAGIGGGQRGSGSNISINGGTVNAASESDGAGIGGGYKGTGSSITVSGGEVTASGGNYGAGIGGGDQGTGSDITISGGTVTATGGTSAAGIGGGMYGNGSEITVSGGTVTATGGAYSAGIGGGSNGTGSGIAVNGGEVTATGGNYGAGIGGGFGESGSNITISDGTVTATGGTYSAGIGGGYNGSGSEITVSGGTVTATGASSAAGIGGGTAESGSGITISGGTVTATSGKYGAGIGGGYKGSGSQITVSGGFVTARGGSGSGSVGAGAAIGNGGGNSMANGTELEESNFTNAVVLRQSGISGSAMTGRAYGNAVPDTDASVPEGAVLTVPEDASLTLQRGMTLTNSGAIYVDSVLNFGGSTYGTLTGTDSVYYWLTVVHGSATAGTVIYPAENGKTYAKANASVTLTPDSKEGETFSGWNTSVDSVTVTDGSFAMSASPLTVTARYESGIQSDYLDYADGSFVKKTTVAIPLTADMTALGETDTEIWYVVNRDVAIESRITVSGNVHLILADGCTLTASQGINVPSGSSLIIYGQESGTGALTANGGYGQAGIGGNASSWTTTDGNNGPITINGGTVTATGGNRGAGIGGGGNYGNGSNITINGGTVMATGGFFGAGIGGGYYGNGSNITVNGGTVTATGRISAAGIGGGGYGNGSDITISGGFVIAAGGVASSSCLAGAAIGNGGSSGADGTETAESNYTNAVVLRQSGISGSAMTGKVYGTAVLDTDATVPTDAILTVPESTSLTLQSGLTLTNSGTIYVDSELNFGGSTYGTLTGTDSVYYWLTVVDGSATEGTVTYPATDGKTYAAEGASVTLTPDSKEGQVCIRWDSSVSSVTVTNHSFTMPASPLTVTARYESGIQADYLDYADESFVKKTTIAIPLTADMTALGKADTEIWYVVNRDVAIESRITVSGDVHLILADGYTLTASQGINVPSGSSLTIYGQESGTGALIVNGGNYQAGIGGNSGSETAMNGSSGPITINGGTVTALGGTGGAGIGGGAGGSGSSITINGGTVTATGGDSGGAGIGGGVNGSGSSITIGGGTVTATGASWGAGIGGGWYGSGSGITISGGTVTATGGDSGAGIGGGRSGSGSEITISGGTVNASGGSYGAGIGGGTGGNGSGIMVSGGTVNATGGEWGAGIGGGEAGIGSDITISGGFVTAVGGSDSGSYGAGASIGNGNSAEADGAEVEESNFTNAVVLRQSGSSGSAMTGKVYGNAVPDTDAEVPPGAVLTVPENTSLTLQSGMTLTNSGTIYVDAVLNFGGDAYGTLTGTDSVYYWLTVNGGSVTEGTEGTVIYPVENGKTYAKENAIVTLAPDSMGETFLGWESSDEGVVIIDNCFSMPASPLTVTARYESGIQVDYLDYVDGSFVKKSTMAIPVTSDMTVLGTENAESWYVVNSDVSFASRITVSGGVHLILADGEILITVKGISVPGDGSLAIYGQEKGTGVLMTGTPDSYYAGIGGDRGSSTTAEGNNGFITINGGTITAKGGNYSAGIGGGDCGSGSNITINGGMVTATGGYSAAGIGGGFSGSGDNIIINGGTVTAQGGANGAGIGGGCNSDGEDITVRGGTVTATGGSSGAGIGGGYNGSGNIIAISGGTVTATGGKTAAGIGGGDCRSGSGITVSGGTVTATGGESSAGIGGGKDASGSNITISGGFVTTVGGPAGSNYGAGAAIGSGGPFLKSQGAETAENNFNNAVVLRQSGSSGSAMTGKVYGNAVPDTDAEVPPGAVLTVPENTSLTLQSGMTLTNSGTIYVDAVLNFGGDAYGTLTGTDSVYYWLTVNGGSVTEGTVTYPGEDGKTYAKENASVTLAPDSTEGEPFLRWETSISGVTVTNHSFTMPARPLTVTAKFGETTVSVDISWGAMSFTYTDGAWDPDTHTNDGGGWTDDGSGWFSVKNNGGKPVNVAYTYTTARTDISGSFTDGTDPVSEPVTLAVNETKKLWLILSGKPDGELNNTELGTVTVSITGGGE